MSDKNNRFKDIDEATFLELLQNHYTEKKIAQIFGIHKDTINNFCKRKYGKTYEQKSIEEQLKSNRKLIKNLLSLSEKNGAVAIYLAKIWLGWIEEKPAEEIPYNPLLNELVDLCREENEARKSQQVQAESIPLDDD